MQKFISPSVLAVNAAGLTPEGTAVCDEPGHCCGVCGIQLQVGEVVDDMRLPATFTNHSSLAYPSEKWRCSACTAIMTRSAFQMGVSTVLITQDDIYPMMRKEHRAWFFLTPPKPPFALAIQNAKQQHTVWRAPVTLNTDQIVMRVGEQVLRIRRPLLLKAAEQAKKINALRVAVGRPSKEALQNPFVNDWKFQSSTGGQLKQWVFKMLADNIISPQDIDALLSLNGAEAWALTPVLHDAPVKPESIKSNIL